MKKMLLFICLLAASMFAQWELQTPKIYADFIDIKFFDTDHGWLLSLEGDLYRTTNGGNSWEVSYADSINNIYRFFFFENNYGWAATEPGGTFSLKTTDGGATWMPTSTPVDYVFFISPDIGFGRELTHDNKSRLHKTTDGGNNWFPVSDTVGVVEVYFINESTGFYSARQGRFFKTTDGGENWNELPQLQSPSPRCPNTWFINNIKFVNDSIGFYVKRFIQFVEGCTVVCPDQIIVAKTTDGGNTWNNYPYGFSFIVDELNWWRLGGLSKSTNGGETWLFINDYPGFAVPQPNTIYFINPNIGFIAGNNGTLFKTTNAGEDWVSVNGALTNFTDGDFVDENNGWAVGDRLIAKTTNGGKDWISIIDTIDINFRAIQFLNKNIGYATGWKQFEGGGFIYKTVDGGCTWTLLREFPGSHSLSDIFVFSDSIAYVNLVPGFLKTTDGGETWVDIINDSIAYSSYFLDSLQGWVTKWVPINDIFTFQKTTDGGKSWYKITTLEINPRAIFFLNENLGWTADNEDIYGTTDGGATWTHQFTGVPGVHSFSDIKFMDENNGWAAGLNNLVRKTTNGGQTWEFDTVIPSENTFEAVEIFNNHVWLFSFAGAIFHQEVQMMKTVELESFTASATNAGIKLQWTTRAETNNKGFEIEKAFITGDPNTEEWSNIAFVPGKGTTSESQVYNYEDNNVSSANVKYRLKNISNSGLFTFSDEVEPSNVTSVEQSKPLSYALEQNYPNPFNPSTTIKYSVPENSFTILKVFDVLGKEVAVLVNEEKAPGRYQVSFNSENLASGIYYYSIDAGSYKEVKKMMLIK